MQTRHHEEQHSVNIQDALDSPHIDSPQLFSVQHNIITNLIGGTFGISIIWYVFHSIMKSEYIHIWALMAFTAMFIHIGIYSAIKKHRHSFSPRQWKLILAFPSFMGGIVWGSLIFFTPDVDIYTLSMVCVFFAVIGTSLGSTGNNMSIFASFSLPITTFLIFHLIQLGGSLFLSMALFSLVYFLVTLSLAYKFTQASAQEHLLLLENKALVQQLADEKQVAETANEDKSRFLASASHDLRQPIHALNVFIEALDQRLTQDNQHEILGKINLSVQAINSLLTSLLDMSRLEAGLVHVEQKAFYLFPMLYKLEDEFFQQAADQGVALSVNAQILCPSVNETSVSDVDVIVQSDPVLLENIFRNLISNALKYTKSGRISISCSALRDGYSVMVQDTGIGIADQDIQKVFDAFYQVGNPERDRSKGIGLGLSIVRQLCQLLDIDLKMSSKLNQGTQFTLHLKSAIEADQQETPLQDINQLQATVLVVDDEQLIIDGMKVMLEPWGCCVLTCQTPNEALQLSSSNPDIDLLLIDYRLRDHWKGTKLIGEIRKTLHRPALPAIIISGDTDPKRIQEMREEGFEVLHKPIKPAQLRGLMQHLLRINNH